MDRATGPCTACGACCVTYRVSFPRHELDTEPGGWVPAAFGEECGGQAACMRGTPARPRRCAALEGTVGVDVRCVIYELRPSPCRDFAPGAVVGHGDAACGDARRLHGLPPLPGSYDGFPIA